MIGFRPYNVMKERYDKIKPIIQSALKDSPLSGIRSLYGFPKGRKKHKEKGIDAAIREFEEEVGISRIHIRILGFPPLEEIYVGTDGKEYKNVYFRCDIPYMLIPRKIKTDSTIPGRQNTVSAEIRDVIWLTKQEAKNYLDKSTFDLI